MAKPSKKATGSAVLILSVLIGGVFGAYLYFRSPVIEMIYPALVQIGDEVTLRGVFFSREGNSVRVGNGYIHNLPSNGKEIIFTLPANLSACEREGCAERAELSYGENQVSVINRRGRESGERTILDIWKTYASEQFRFSFGYPESYKLAESGAYDSQTGKRLVEPWIQVTLTTSTGIMVLGVNTEKITSWGDGCKILDRREEDRIFGSLAVKKITRYGGVPCFERHVEYRFKSGGHSFVFEGQLNGMLDGIDFEKTAETILPTFSFY